jgi:tetratricopeptide (TPR) repeat protein
MSAMQAAAFKAEGNEFFKAKNYKSAIEKYTCAIECATVPDVTFFSNRSACHAALEHWAEASEDGRNCIMTDKNFVKGYFRQALGLKGTGDIEGALTSVQRGLGISSTNADLKRMSTELNELVRLKKVDAAITRAETQLGNNEIKEAFNTIDGAMRQDPTNEKLKKLLSIVQPKFEREEKLRKSKLDPNEAFKEEGDTMFKAADFEGAIKKYTKCIDKIKDHSSALALKAFGNRAACYKQLSNFDGTIGDCTAVLEHKPEDVKALMRRAQAFEACERYKSSMQDVRSVLALGMEVAGKASYDLANGMQHRLNRVIADLKKSY